MRWAVILILVLASPVLQAAPTESRLVLAGAVKVVDGDTIEIGGQRIRLWAIDTPEIGALCKYPDGEAGQCGQLAKLYLRNVLVIVGSVECSGNGIDRYRRVVAICRHGKHGLTLAIEMLKMGQARWVRRYDLSETLKAHEDEARRKGRGFWSCKAPTPKGWRALKRKSCAGLR